MAYTNNTGKSYNQQPKPRNETFTFKITDEFVSKNKTVLDPKVVMDILNSLYNDGVFTILSTSIQASRAMMMNDNEKKGSMNIGFIKSIDGEKNEMEVTVYSTSVENIKRLVNANGDNLKIVPRIISHLNDDLITFTAFDLVIY